MEDTRKKDCKIHILQAEMANVLEVAQTMQAITTHLELADNLENCPMEAEHHTYVQFLEEGDLGVEVMSKKTFEQLAVLLSFPGGLPGNWNTYMHKDGITVWHLRLTPLNLSVT